jgi:hypothetical protein
MAEPSRGQQISRRSWLAASLAASVFPARAANSLIVTYDGDNLHVSSLGVHFLKDKSLQRLKDGSTVVYVATLSLFRDTLANQIKRQEYRFKVSKDVLGTEDRFQVVFPGTPTRKAENLSKDQAETWAFERLLIPTQGIARDRQLWVQLELRTALPKMQSVFGESRFFVDIIELLTPGEDERQTFLSSPRTLDDMAKRRAG